MSTKKPAADLSSTDDELSYEQARAELAEIVRALEAGNAGLEESLQLWQRGEDLAARCQQWLAGASVRVQAAISARDNGTDDHSQSTDS